MICFCVENDEHTHQKVLMDEKWSHEKHKTNEGFETLNFLHVQAFYFDGMFASQVNTNNVSICCK